MMIEYRKSLIAASLVALAITSSTAWAQPADGERLHVPPVPQNLEVPAGHVAFLAAHAWGTQNYICLPTASWSLESCRNSPPAPRGGSWVLRPRSTRPRTVNGSGR